MTLVWLLVALLLLGGGAFWWFRMRRPPAPPAQLDASADDLQSFGLSAVRARPAGASRSAPRADEAPRPDPAPIEEEALEEEEIAAREEPEAVTFDDLGVSSARPITTAPKPEPVEENPPPDHGDASDDAEGPLGEEHAEEEHISLVLDEQSPLWRGGRAEEAAYLLEQLWASLRAQSVALLSYDERSEAYAVDALISRAAALSTAPFPSSDNLLHSVPSDRSISLLEADALPALRYHADPASAVGFGAALVLDAPQARVLLVADGAPEQETFSDRHLALLGEYADQFARFFAAAAVEAESSDAVSEDGAVSEDAGREDADLAEAARTERAREASSSSAVSGDTKRPPIRLRSAILADEIEAARAADRPLAFALVVPRDAVALSAEGADAIAEAEAQLFGRLHQLEGSARVERFGELLAGVFCYAGPALVEAWAERVADAGPPVHIGVALLRARHTDPEALRADAAAALREAYERHEGCVILE